MNTKKKVAFSVLILVVLVVVFYFSTMAITRYTGKVISGEAMNDFAQCLTEKNVSMYGAFWCSHCANQKKIFGDSWKYIHYIECDGNNLCAEKGIGGYPTWEINNKFYPGEKSLKKLASLSGCKLGG